MPVYGFRCDGCRCDHEVFAPIREGPPPNLVCLTCHAPLRRIWAWAVKSPYQEHFNESVGQFVRSDREFRDALKRGSEEATLRTGIEHNYVPVDVGDVVRETQPDEAQQKRMHAERQR